MQNLYSHTALQSTTRRLGFFGTVRYLPDGIFRVNGPNRSTYYKNKYIRVYQGRYYSGIDLRSYIAAGRVERRLSHTLATADRKGERGGAVEIAYAVDFARVLAETKPRQQRLLTSANSTENRLAHR